MIVVVEPDVAIKWFVEEPLRPQARSLLAHGHELIAPDHAEPIIRTVSLSSFIESTRLRNRALALALQGNWPVHDCFYAVCVEATSAPLVSSDESFPQVLNPRGIAVCGVPLACIHEPVGA
jgi:hypothetical protein